jgi:hypothetical protein
LHLDAFDDSDIWSLFVCEFQIDDVD